MKHFDLYQDTSTGWQHNIKVCFSMQEVYTSKSIESILVLDEYTSAGFNETITLIKWLA